MRVSHNLSVVAAASLVIGCVEPSSDSWTDTPRIIRNAITFDHVTANLTPLEQLAGAKLNLSSAAGQAMLDSAEDRDVLDHFVSCALRNNVSVKGTYGGVTYKFTGKIGLGKTWKHKKLTAREKKWVSACVIARINAHGQVLYISLRGPHSALNVTASEANRFTLEEGAFYGDLLSGSAKAEAWSCRGEAQFNGEGDEGDALGSRDCAEPALEDVPTFTGVTSGQNQCGFWFAGDAWDFTPGSPSPHACEQRAMHDPDDGDDDSDSDSDSENDSHYVGDGFYKRCRTTNANGKPPRLFKEVVTVYVEDGPPLLEE